MPEPDADNTPRSTIILELLVGGLAVVLVAAIVAKLLDAPPGSVAEWVSAIATVFTLIAASAAAWFTRQTLGIEQDREEQWKAQQRSSQAVLVAAWATGSTGWVRGPEERLARPLLARTEVAVTNASPVPVTQVWLDLTVVIERNALPPIRLELGQHRIYTLPPTGDHPHVITVEAPTPIDLTEDYGVDINAEDAYFIEVEIAFRDAGGWAWSRAPDGMLLSIASPTGGSA